MQTGEAVARGEEVHEHAGVYFTSIEAFRRAITHRRLQLLNIIKTNKPNSINELASMAQRNIKNVAGDMKLLEQIGLVEIRETKNRMIPQVDYDEIDIRIALIPHLHATPCILPSKVTNVPTFPITFAECPLSRSDCIFSISSGN